MNIIKSDWKHIDNKMFLQIYFKMVLKELNDNMRKTIGIIKDAI